MNGRRIGGILALVLLVVLVAAWIDGGEEPMRSIEQSVEVPEGAR